ncbi:MAG: hypothetical protein LBE33_02620 [Zoogloeaceae bacterium]|jgi:hypothetical protein|nr:hypothetical protein [Zoogloeaceae bacterium]
MPAAELANRRVSSTKEKIRQKLSTCSWSFRGLSLVVAGRVFAIAGAVPIVAAIITAVIAIITAVVTAIIAIITTITVIAITVTLMARRLVTVDDASGKKTGEQQGG